MRRWLIVLGLVAVVLGAALAVAAANLGRFLGAHRDRIAARAAREIGRPVELGDLRVSVRGGPGVHVAGVRVAETPEWGGGDLLRAEDVWVTVRLLPALVGRFEIARVTVRHPVLTVIRDQRGWNLATLGRQRRHRKPRPESPPSRERGRLAALVGLADVRDGEVRYLDRRHEPARELVARHVSASASDVTAGRPIGVTLRAALFGAETPNLDVTGSVGPVDDPPEPAHAPLDLRWTVDGVDSAALAGAAGIVDATLPRELIVAGPLAAHGHLQGTPDQPIGQAALDASGAAIRLGTAFAKPADVALTAALDLSRDGEALAVRRATLALGEATLEATGSIVRGTPPTVDLRLTADRAPLTTLASVVPATTSADVGGTIEAQLTVQGAWQAQPLPAIAGTVALAGVHARRSADRIGLSGLTTTVTVADGAAQMPVTRFQIGGSPVDASGVFRIADRLLTVDGKSADVFGGTVEGTGRIELADPRQPRFATTATVRGVALAPLLAARESPLASHLEGRLDADVALAGSGARRRAVRRSLTGTARIDVRDGVVRGLRIVDEVLGTVIGIDGAGRLVPGRLRRKRPELFGGADTTFEELRASARIADRTAHTDDLVMRTGSYTVTGRGRVHFDGRTELTATFVAGPALTADVLDSVKDARWAMNADQRIEVPFQVTGQFPHLRPRPDPAFVARVVGRALEARARKALGADGKKDDRQGGLVDGAIRRLERLLGR